MENIVNIANIYINLGHWLSHFKVLLSIIIPKSNKITYDSFKSFYSIVLLNILSKLIEKVISEHLQFYSIANNLIYPNQLEGLKQCLTRCGHISNLFNLIWIGQKPSDEHINIQYHSIFPIFKSSINFFNS